MIRTNSSVGNSWNSNLNFYTRFINRKTFKERRSFQLSKAVEILEQEEFDNAKPTVIYMHGYLENMEYESIKVITDAYLTRGDHSELIVDIIGLSRFTIFYF